MTNLTSTSFPIPNQPKVSFNPDVTTKYYGYNPNTYQLDALIKGIFRDRYMSSITDLKNSQTHKWLSEFIEEADWIAILGNADRHIEFGRFWVEKYEDINRAGVNLAPVSGHHINVVSETDRTTERMVVRVGYNREDSVNYFFDYGTFSQFMDGLKGNMINAVKDALAMIVTGILTADPSSVIFDSRDISRVFNKTWDNRPATQ